ncbi:hypothetical protein [uncultured Phascolarctobacterium sp.]|uniref:hypothetical protein n=1 Tax=uncultured Phascolarctobacterium sp. TaxID=512296 RepID=UPI002612B1BD|nr:hypothetical protein [uncultured Phascolarctobacterium sp.]
MDIKTIIPDALALNQEQIINTYDYYVDGVLYCGKCNTPKEEHHVFQGHKFCAPRKCRCELEKSKCERDAKDKADNIIKLQQQARDYRFIGFLPSTYNHVCLDDDDNKSPTISKRINDYVDNFDEYRRKGKGLLLWGPNGSGKSFAAKGIVNKLVERNYPCLVTNTEKFSLAFSHAKKSEIIDALMFYELVLIDDIYLETIPDWFLEVLFLLIDTRYNCQKPMLVTTNTNIKNILNSTQTKHYRIWSRLIESCYPIKFDKIDRRKDILLNDYTDYDKSISE